MKRILVADDHSIVRKGLRVLCETQFGFTDVDEADNCSSLMKTLKRKSYSHLILDIVLSDGLTLEILPNIRSLYPDLAILVFTMQPLSIYRSALHHHGVRQYISKAAPEAETIRLLQDFLYDRAPGISPGAAGPTSGEGAKMAFDDFTPRETEVLHYMLMGIGSVEIGNRLNMKSNTVSTFKRRIFEKSNTKNIMELKEFISLYRKDT
jgi:DNA-binding NarL/FixJ family response regulator